MRRLILFLSLALSAPAFGQAELADATAKYLAGMSVAGTPLEARSRDPAWQRHAAEMTRAWNQLEVDQLAKIRAWAPDFLGEHYVDSGPMYYMFSGPDFLYANVFFPNASTYFLCGLEPVGAIPNLDRIPRPLVDPILTNLRKSLESSLSWSFFITQKMKGDMAQKELSGTLPILYVFLARLGPQRGIAVLLQRCRLRDRRGAARNGRYRGQDAWRFRGSGPGDFVRPGAEG